MGGYRDDDAWECVFRLKREIERMMESHTLADVMAREKSPYLLSSQNNGANRAERRRQKSQARKDTP